MVLVPCSLSCYFSTINKYLRLYCSDFSELLDGCVFFPQVSHDEHLISGSVDELWAVSEGRVTPFDGTFQDYKKKLQSSS